ncbi:MAG: hypothetical protein KDD55_13970, partial [Bdellovibrionales bacterium]|nr:hypothetical protein [Bdellovibrionales bacterium]
MDPIASLQKALVEIGVLELNTTEPIQPSNETGLIHQIASSSNLDEQHILIQLAEHLHCSWIDLEIPEVAEHVQSSNFKDQVD